MNVIIVGGGTAGWLAALFLSKNHPMHTYTLIESSDIGVIGTGEGSTGALTGVIFNQMFPTGGSPVEFVKFTNATPKLGIKFSGWSKSDFFSPIDGSLLANSVPDALMLNSVVYDIPAHLATTNGVRLEHQLLPFTNINDLSYKDPSAWHFDGKLVGKYFKSLCNTVSSIDAKVINVLRDHQNNVTSIKLDNGQEVIADVVIDCSGFNSIFKLSDEGIEDYSTYLPVNCAIPFFLPNTDLDKTPLHTDAIALKHGWVWKIPVGDRFGCGYVFDKNTTTTDSALKEVEDLFGNIDPIKEINFKSAMLKKPWLNNVIRIGLSSGFLEPLQATAIHTVIAQLYMLTFELFRNDTDATVNPANQIAFNHYSNYLRNNFVDLINLHYKTGRTDSEFWKYMQTSESTTDKNKEILEISKYRFPNVRDLPNVGFNVGSNLLGPVIAGLGLVDKPTAKRELDFVLSKNPYDLRITLESMKQGVMENSPYSMQDFIRNFR